MRCTACNAELSSESKFCPDCGQSVSPMTAPAFVPASASFSPQVPVAPDTSTPVTAPYVVPAYPTCGPATYAQDPAYGWYGQPAYGSPYMEESDYYHFDATEKLDFEAMRGISIVLLVLSVICVVTIVFPLPLAIIALVKSCSGKDIADPYKAKKQFSACRTLVIICITTFVAIFLLVLLSELLVNPSFISEKTTTGTELLNMLR